MTSLQPGSNAGDDCARCFYCSTSFGQTRHEHDHAPIPQCNGGTETVPSCVTCHDLKDRGGFCGLPVREAYEAVLSLAVHGDLGDALLGHLPTEWPARWSEMGRWERIVWGRVAALAHRDECRSESLLWSVMLADHS